MCVLPLTWGIASCSRFFFISPVWQLRCNIPMRVLRSARKACALGPRTKPSRLPSRRAWHSHNAPACEVRLESLTLVRMRTGAKNKRSSDCFAFSLILFALSRRARVFYMLATSSQATIDSILARPEHFTSVNQCVCQMKIQLTPDDT